MACCFSPPSISKWNAASLLKSLLCFGSCHIISFCFTKDSDKKRLFGSPWFSWPVFFHRFFFFLFKGMTHHFDPYWLFPVNPRVLNSLWKKVKYFTLIIHKSIGFQMPTKLYSYSVYWMITNKCNGITFFFKEHRNIRCIDKYHQVLVTSSVSKIWNLEITLINEFQL